MNNNGFLQYLNNNGFYVYDPPFTHLLLNGGKLRVPNEMKEDFLIKYSQYCQSYKLYVIELKTKVFRFFLDLDFFQHIGLPHNMLIKYITVIQKAVYTTISSTHDPKESRIIVCLTENKDVVKNNEKFVKTGVHVYWPEVYVNTEYSLIFREIIIEQLNDQFGERGSHNTWDDVVDKVVLEKNGLRMIGSRKLSNCSHCKTNKIKNAICAVCNGSGRIDEGRVYYPYVVLDGKGKEMKGELKKLTQSTFKTVKETSIRSELTDIPKPFQIPEKYFVHKKPKKKPHQKNNKNETITDLECSHKDCLEKTSKAFKLCKQFIQQNFPHPNTIEITEIFRKGKEKQYYIVRTPSRFCMNINREHNSNHVYYYIDKSFAYQKCLCTCDTTEGRQYGKCMDYVSGGRRLPVELQKLLFPQEQKMMAVLFDMPVYDKNDTKANKHKYVEGLESYCKYLEDGLFKREQAENMQIMKTKSSRI